MKTRPVVLFVALIFAEAGIVAAGPIGTNLIVNGNFEAGNTGFFSDYATYSNAIGITESTYQVLQNPSIGGNPAATSYGDHTTGTGLMMAVNGSPIAGRVVWGETIAVTPNTTYDFAAYLSSWYPTNPAILDFSVNGSPIGSLAGTSTTGQWALFFSTWNSGSSSSATITIVNRNTFIQGNDFALDDIYFGVPVFSQPELLSTPEPTSLALAGFAGLGMAAGAWRRRRQQKQQAA